MILFLNPVNIIIYIRVTEFCTDSREERVAPDPLLHPSTFSLVVKVSKIEDSHIILIKEEEMSESWTNLTTKTLSSRFDQAAEVYRMCTQIGRGRG